jgi:hypothetical protein
MSAERRLRSIKPSPLGDEVLKLQDTYRSITGADKLPVKIQERLWFQAIVNRQKLQSQKRSV